MASIPDGLKKSITTADDARNFIKLLVAANLSFHLEDAPSTVINGETDEPLFSEHDAAIVAQRLKEVYAQPKATWRPSECPIGYMMFVEEGCPKYMEEFPDFFASELPAIPEGWADESWRNDSCPHFVTADKLLLVYVDFEDPASREEPISERFSVHTNPEIADASDVLFSSDDWVAVLAFVANYKSSIAQELAQEFRS